MKQCFWLALLAACSPSSGTDVPDAAARQAWLTALSSLPEQPEQAAQQCLEAGPHAGGCMWAVVESAPAHPQAQSWCDALPAGRDRDECHFLRAEGTRSLEDCATAGVFTDDCRLHLFTERIGALDISPRDPRAVQAAVQPLLSSVGAEQDERYWSAALRWSLSHQRPMDRGVCSDLDGQGWQEACAHTALAVYGDRLNRTRDFGGGLPCDDRTLPIHLQHTPDAELDAMRQQWRQRDGCAPR